MASLVQGSIIPLFCWARVMVGLRYTANRIALNTLPVQSSSNKEHTGVDHQWRFWGVHKEYESWGCQDLVSPALLDLQFRHSRFCRISNLLWNLSSLHLREVLHSFASKSVQVIGDRTITGILESGKYVSDLRPLKLTGVPNNFIIVVLRCFDCSGFDLMVAKLVRKGHIGLTKGDRIRTCVAN